MKLCEKCRLEIAMAIFNENERHAAEDSRIPCIATWGDMPTKFQNEYLELADAAFKQIEHIREHGHDAELEKTCH